MVARRIVSILVLVSLPALALTTSRPARADESVPVEVRIDRPNLGFRVTSTDANIVAGSCNPDRTACSLSLQPAHYTFFVPSSRLTPEARLEADIKEPTAVRVIAGSKSAREVGVALMLGGALLTAIGFTGWVLDSPRNESTQKSGTVWPATLAGGIGLTLTGLVTFTMNRTRIEVEAAPAPSK